MDRPVIRSKSASSSLDKRLLPRISQYVDTQPKQKYINTAEVVTYLQNKYPEYNRRKKKALSTSVQKVLQEILVERYGPQNKKSRTKSFTLDNNSDTSDSEVECDDQRHPMPLMVVNSANSMNNSMRNIYRQSQSQPTSPATARKDNSPIVSSVPSSPLSLYKRKEKKGSVGSIGASNNNGSEVLVSGMVPKEKRKVRFRRYVTIQEGDRPEGFFIDRGKRNHSIAGDKAVDEFSNLTHKSMDEYMSLRKELSSDGLISDEIIEEAEETRPEIFETIEDKLENALKEAVLKSEAVEENKDSFLDKKEEKKSKLINKTVISVEELEPQADYKSQRRVSAPHSRSARSESREQGSEVLFRDDVKNVHKRRESAPHSKRSDSEFWESYNDHKRRTRRTSTDKARLLRPAVEGHSNEEDDHFKHSYTSKSSRRRSSRFASIESGNTNREHRCLTQTTTTFIDVAGAEDTMEEVSRLLLHLSHPEVFTTLGVSPTRGILLHGPPGCGKTLLANAIGGEMKLPFFSVTATELVSGVSGESEHNIRNLFRQARALAPSILFLDEIDAIAPKREESGKDMEKRIVAQLLTCIDDLDKPGPNVLLLAATSRPDSIEPSLRRAGRLDREICLGIPNERQRIAILTKLCQTLKLGDNFDFHQIAHNTPGYVGADLVSLVREASLLSIERYLPQLLDNGLETKKPDTPGSSSDEEQQVHGRRSSTKPFRAILCQTRSTAPFSEEKLADVCIELKDFMAATKLVQPSAKREGFATVPDVTWDDVGAMVDIREELTMSILAPVKYPEKFEALGLSRSQGILIAGPPGCGKTLIAKAVANESGINFISVKGPELLNMYVGESERAVRMVFQRARASAPCVIFFDEIDSLVPKRSASEGSSAARVVNQLLTEMDGMESRKSVFIIAATNRPDIIDPAMLRPGRLDKTLFVSLPNSEDRLAILRTITKNGTKPTLNTDVVLKELAESCEGYTGADLSALIREASICCLKEEMLSGKSGDNCVVGKSHFTKALANITPSVSLNDRLLYEAMKNKHSKGGMSGMT